MEQVVQTAAVCILAALLAAVVRRGAPEAALLLGLAAAVGVLLALSGELRTLAGFFTELAARTGAADGIFLPLYKTIGIALVVKVGASLCRDAGTAALASALEISGAACALLAALPLLERTLSVLLELME